jgi:hypothetical protein
MNATAGTRAAATSFQRIRSITIALYIPLGASSSPSHSSPGQTRTDARAAAVAAELRAERAERLELEAQLAALRAQLDPHLLFNGFNTVAALIPTDAAAAERTLLRLAELYRGLLAASRRELHTLERELDICCAYLDIERARFAERLAARSRSPPVSIRPGARCRR